MADRRIHISPSWSFRDDSGQQLDRQLFVLLGAIHEQGKLTAAAKQAGISYRHGWNLLNKWAAFFGTELVTLEKGRGARLTPLGEKLLWAEQRVVARLQPQMENLASELNVEIHRALEDITPLLRMHASHGYAVALLPQFTDNFQLDLQYKSPLDALASLNRGSCDIAGFHLPVDVPIRSQRQVYDRLLKPRAHRIIRFITRRMGLMVARGNPRRIGGIADLRRDDIRFVNRQKDSGTRALLDQLLHNARIAHKEVQGFDDEEFTHSAVAAYVGAGMADVGFGVEAAARQFDLDFVAVTEEHYLLLCHQRSLNQAAMQAFISTIQSPVFLQAVDNLPGYSADLCGEIQAVEDVFPGI